MGLEMIKSTSPEWLNASGVLIFPHLITRIGIRGYSRWSTNRWIDP